MKRFLITLILSAFFTTSAMAADTYTVDLSHSQVGFSVKHMGISNVKGNFKDFSGTITLDNDDITKSSVDVTIQVASVDTDNEKRDNHLRSADFFDVENHPTMTFKSKSLKKDGDNLILVGDLTMRGTTKQVEIPFVLNGPVDLGERAGTRLGAEGNLTIDRGDFGVSFGLGEIAVGDKVKIILEIEAIKQ